MLIDKHLFKNMIKALSKDAPITSSSVPVNSGSSTSSPTLNNKTIGLSKNNNPSGPSTLIPSAHPPGPSITRRFRPDGTQCRSITPLEAIYYHERLDLITHPLIKGLIKWKWDNYAAKHFYIGLALELLFLILWTCSLLIMPFPIRYVYRFPQDIWRCALWTVSIAFLIWKIIQEIIGITYTRQRYEDYLIWESERTKLQLDLISKNKYKSNIGGQSPQSGLKTINNTEKMRSGDTGEIENVPINEMSPEIPINLTMPNTRTYHSQQSPLLSKIPAIIKGKASKLQSSQQTPIDIIINSSDPLNNTDSTLKKRMESTTMTPDASIISPWNFHRRRSRFARFVRNFRDRAKTRMKSYYMYYSLNNLFDWLIYILCIITIVTHCIDVSGHTVFRARVHMYIASITVIGMWFRFMAFFRTIIISARTLRSKLIEIKLGELVIMVSFEKEKSL